MKKIATDRNKLKTIFLLLFLGTTLLLAILPFTGISEYILRLVALILFWAGLAGSWNLMSGYTGYIDFGPVVYFGIGSYVTAISMTQFFLPFPVAFFLSGIIAAIISIPVGFSALRLKGAYFAIATFAFAETMKQITLEFDRTFHVRFFEGSHGITLPMNPHGNTFFFFFILATSCTIIAFHYFVENSKFGYGLKAINEAEDSAELSGVNTTQIKMSAYVISALFLGLFGGIEAYWISYITPTDVFNVQKTVQMVIMTLLGGMGTILGPVLGSVVLTSVSEILGTASVEYYLIVLGIMIVGIILVMPRGIMGYIKERKQLKLI